MKISGRFSKVFVNSLLITALVVTMFTGIALAGGAKFYNPIMNDGADPWVVYKDGYYYYIGSNGDNLIYVTKSPSDSLTRLGSDGVRVDVWTAPTTGPNSKQIWAPELHFIDNKWYIYYAASDGLNENHRMFVLESNSSDPQGSYTDKGKIAAATDKWAIDGHPFLYNSEWFFTWSGWPGDTNEVQNLYIAEMSDPWTIFGDRVLISTPEYDWEKVGDPDVNEGQTSLIKSGSGTVNIVYSASGSWTDDYALGLLTNTSGNMMDATAWSKKSTPVFSKTSDVFGPGHPSFVKSPDGSQDWIVYHAAKESGSGWDRNIRTQQFSWNTDDTPNFGAPVSPTVRLDKPAGEPVLNTYGWGDSASGTAEFGNWNHNSTSSADNTTLGGYWFHTFTGDVNATDYIVTADAAWQETGTIAAYPKYGIYAAYKDSDNYVAAFIDKNSKVFATYGVVNGSASSWQNTSIKGNFNYSAYNTIKAVKTGSTFEFYLNGTLMQTRTFNISNGQTGLVSEDTLANYQNVSVQ